MIRPRLHDRATASREELLDHIAAQEHYIGWLHEGIGLAKTLMTEMRTKLETHTRLKPTEKVAPPGSAFGDLFEGFFGSKKP